MDTVDVDDFRNERMDIKQVSLSNGGCLKYKFLFYLVLTALIGVLAVIIIEYWQYGLQREMTVVVKNPETAAYDLFDRQFSRLLAVMSAFLGVFGLVVPILAYFFQRESLHYERKRILEEAQMYEKKLSTRVLSLRNELNNLAGTVKNDFVRYRKESSSELEKMIETINEFERELSYRLGMHFFLSGSNGISTSDYSLTKVMDLFYGLEQFGKYPDYVKSTRMIDSTLVNMLILFDNEDAYKYLAIHSSYTLEALKILRRIVNMETLKQKWRDVARTIARNIAKRDKKRRKKL